MLREMLHEMCHEMFHEMIHEMLHEMLPVCHPPAALSVCLSDSQTSARKEFLGRELRALTTLAAAEVVLPFA